MIWPLHLSSYLFVFIFHWAIISTLTLRGVRPYIILNYQNVVTHTICMLYVNSRSSQYEASSKLENSQSNHKLKFKLRSILYLRDSPPTKLPSSTFWNKWHNVYLWHCGQIVLPRWWYCSRLRKSIFGLVIRSWATSKFKSATAALSLTETLQGILSLYMCKWLTNAVTHTIC